MKGNSDFSAWLRRLPSGSWITDDEALHDNDPPNEAEGFPNFEEWSAAAECSPDEITAGWQRMRTRLEFDGGLAKRRLHRVHLGFWRLAVAAALAAGFLLGVVGDRLVFRSHQQPQILLNTELVDVLRTRSSSQAPRGGALATLVIFAPSHTSGDRFGVQILDRHDNVLSESWGLVLDSVDLTFTLTIPSDLLHGPATKLRLLGATGDEVEVLEEQPLPTLVDVATEPGGTGP